MVEGFARDTEERRVVSRRPLESESKQMVGRVKRANQRVNGKRCHDLIFSSFGECETREMKRDTPLK